MIVQSLKTHKIKAGDDLYKILDKYLPPLQEKSVVAITSKIISICQGDVIKNDGTVDKDELVIKESDFYIKGDPDSPYGNVYLTQKNGHIAFSAGIDESNANGYFILWPKNIQEITNKIWEYLCNKNKIENLGIIVTDSRLTPAKTGVVGFGISWCGFKPFNEFSGTPDLFGREIKFTNVNLVEGLSASATTVMGETTEQTPLAVLSDLPFVQFQNHVPTNEEIESMNWPIEKDMYGALLNSAKWQKGGRGK